MASLHPAVAATRSAVASALRTGPGAPVASGDLVLVGVSGGADSLALAAAAAHVGPRCGLRVGAVTVDHRLQPGSAQQADDVARCARALGFDPVVVETVSVAGGGGPEAAARRARYDAVLGAARRTGASAVLVGHTLDDQAETVLLGLARGSGSRSLAGMAAVSAWPTETWTETTPAGAEPVLLRPFLAIRRAQTVAACEAEGLTGWQDPHNSDPAYRRVRVRATLLPELEATLGPGVAEALARTAALARADADALDGWAARELEALRDGTDVSLPVLELAALPGAVRTRVLRLAALAAGAAPGALRAEHVRSLDRLVTHWHGQGEVTLPGGLVADRRCDRLRYR